MIEQLSNQYTDEILAEVLATPDPDPDTQATLLLLTRSYGTEHMMARRERVIAIIKAGNMYDVSAPPQPLQ
jgi:hypothetical protein